MESRSPEVKDELSDRLSSPGASIRELPSQHRNWDIRECYLGVQGYPHHSVGMRIVIFLSYVREN